MFFICGQIDSLQQHLCQLHQQPDDYKVSHCPYCYCTRLWRHGCYYRQSDRIHPASATLNAIPIPRFRCSKCLKTCSTLPECLPPLRWYEWCIQEQAIQLYLSGKTYRSIAKLLKPGRTTIGRWIRHLKACIALHTDFFRQHLKQLQLISEFNSVWSVILSNFTLARTMYFLHQGGIVIP